MLLSPGHSAGSGLIGAPPAPPSVLAAFSSNASLAAGGWLKMDGAVSPTIYSYVVTPGARLYSALAYVRLHTGAFPDTVDIYSDGLVAGTIAVPAAAVGFFEVSLVGASPPSASVAARMLLTVPNTINLSVVILGWQS